MPPPVAQQVISTMRIIMGKDGTQEGLLFKIYIHFYCSELAKVIIVMVSLVIFFFFLALWLG